MKCSSARCNMGAGKVVLCCVVLCCGVLCCVPVCLCACVPGHTTVTSCVPNQSADKKRGQTSGEGSRGDAGRKRRQKILEWGVGFP